nr:hypothetical protein Iba_chr13bCG0920 [Ipomoea batatas]
MFPPMSDFTTAMAAPNLSGSKRDLKTSRNCLVSKSPFSDLTCFIPSRAGENTVPPSIFSWDCND